MPRSRDGSAGCGSAAAASSAKSGVGCFRGRQFSGVDAEEAHDLLATGLAGDDHPRRLRQVAAVVPLAVLPLAVAR